MEKLEETKECNKTWAPFKVEAKIYIKPYVDEIDALKLNQWLQHLEVYFSVHEVSGAQIISFTYLMLEGHALTWWENDAIA